MKRKNFIYYLKNISKQIEYYPVYMLDELLELLLEKMKVKINFNRSAIFKKEVKLCLKICVD